MNGPERLIVVTHRQAGSTGDRALVDLAAFCGVNSELLDLDLVSVDLVLETMEGQSRPSAAFAASTFVHLTADNRERFKRFIQRTRGASLLLHSIHPDVARSTGWLADLLGAEVSLNRVPDDRLIDCCFARKRPEWTGPLTGATVGRLNPRHDAMLQISRGASLPFPLITPGMAKVGGEVIFAQIRLGDGSVYVCSAQPPDDVYDVEGMAAWLTPERSTRLLPLLLFVRGIFNAGCWRQPRPRGAFIWPDARLVQRPDNIELREVAEQGHRLEQHICLAVPPAEFARFDPVAVRIARQYPGNLSIVPYGNNGGEGDLAGGSEAASAVAQASARMNEFARRCKLPWGRVMVAPGGIWAPPALEALRAHGYRALIGAPAPRASGAPWKFYEGLDPAAFDLPGATPAGRGDGILPLPRAATPVLAMRSDGGAEQALIDAFVGRPVIVQLKPEWFDPKAGPGALALMEQLGALDQKIRWTDLETLAQSLYWVRRTEPRGGGGPVAEVRMFAEEVVVEGIDLTTDRVEALPPVSPLDAFCRVPLDAAQEGRWIESPAGALQFQVLDEQRLKIALRRPPAPSEDVALDGGGWEVTRKVADWFRRLRPARAGAR